MNRHAVHGGCAVFISLLIVQTVQAQTVASYTCYQGKDLKLNPGVIHDVSLQDQLIDETVELKDKVRAVCYPTGIDGLPIPLSPALVCYQIKAQNLSPPVKILATTEVLIPMPPEEEGTSQPPLTTQFLAEKGKLLCVPAIQSSLPLP